MTDLRQRIAQTLQNHPMLDHGRECGCGDWRAWTSAGPNGCYEEHVADVLLAEHVADVLLAVLQPDIDTMNPHICPDCGEERGWGVWCKCNTEDTDD